jgi:hypothetical protein
MGQFKPMVKMMTTEPTVELKLKKGGSAHKKMKHGGDADHKPMQSKMNGGIMGALSGATPVIAVQQRLLLLECLHVLQWLHVVKQ